MASGIKQSQDTFKEEAWELLEQLEESLLELEEASDDIEEVNRVFRSLHTLKGSGAMFGFVEIAEFTHELEAAYDMVRNDKIKVTPELIQLTLQAHDLIGQMLRAHETESAVDPTRAKNIIKALKELLPLEEKVTMLSPTVVAAGTSPSGGREKIFRIRFHPHENFFLGNTPLPLLRELSELGHCSIILHLDDLPPLDELDPETCYASWDIILNTTAKIEKVKDVFLFVEDSCELDIHLIDDSEDGDVDLDYKKLGEILVDRGDISQDELGSILRAQTKLGGLLTESGLVDSSSVEAALVEQEEVQKARKQRQTGKSKGTIRVPSDKLDSLVELVGELTTLQAHISQVSQSRNDPEINAIAEGVERLVAELRDNTMELRMLPIGSIFNKFRRLIRDLSQELGKIVNMTTSGAETELDKTIIEQLNDPLIHIIRNSVDHGIESTAQRVAAGKSPEGNIHLSAIHEGANILIRIKDDGGGLDLKRIREKAIQKGIIQEESQISDQETMALIFHAGFSTAAKVTSISGRGVGMDVVKRSIEDLRGTIDVNSKLGQGTTITLRLPLTLTMIDGLLVRVGKNFYIFPLSVVEECVALIPENMMNLHGQPVIRVREEILPYIYLRELFNVNEPQDGLQQVVISEVGDRKVGFAIDAVVGEYQAVIKPLGRILNGKDKFSGTTILGDGTVALILNIGELSQQVEA